MDHPDRHTWRQEGEEAGQGGGRKLPKGGQRGGEGGSEREGEGSPYARDAFIVAVGAEFRGLHDARARSDHRALLHHHVLHQHRQRQHRDLILEVEDAEVEVLIFEGVRLRVDLIQSNEG